MNIDKYLDVINACRFCFMCRHLPPLGNVTFKEADTPRGRALILDKVRMDKANLAVPDYIKTIYEAPLSAACRKHCVSSYDESGLLLAARKDIVEAGLAPECVIEIAAKLGEADFKVSGDGNVLYYVDMYSDESDAPADCKTISGGDTGKALEVLGFANEATEVFDKFKSAVAASDCKTVVTSCPASYDMMKDNLDSVKVMHSSEYLEPKAGSGKIYYLDSDFLKNYCDLAAPRELLEKCGYELVQFGTNPEESYSAGEGAVVYDKLYPGLTAKLCARIVELADAPANDVLVTASPYTKAVLKQYAPQLNVMLLDEVVTKGIA